jgi:NADP-dependent 3-hydroxy acid dehydrogenase YdfG
MCATRPCWRGGRVDAEGEMGSLDIVVANAGIVSTGPLEEVNDQTQNWLQPEDVSRGVLHLVTDPG